MQMKRYIVFERPEGSKCWTIAYKRKGGNRVASFGQRESAEEFIKDEHSKRACFCCNMEPQVRGLEAFIAEVELPK